VYQKHGAYYLVKHNRWTNLGKNLPAALAEYARRITASSGLSELIDEFLKDSRRTVKSNTLRQYEQAARTVQAAFIEFAPDQVCPEHIWKFLQHHRSTPNMANRMRSVLKMVFDRAVLAGQCATNPVTSVPRFSEKKRDRYISDDEYTRLIEAASPTLRVIINMAYLTGQRIGDVLKIKQSDISPDGITVVQEKTGKKLKVAMTPTLEENIRAARRLHGRITPTYLLGQRNGKIRKYKGVRDLLQRYVDKAGLDDIHLHDFRAKAITDAKKQGYDPQALAGHTTEAQTVRYLRDKEIPLVYGPSFRQ